VNLFDPAFVRFDGAAFSLGHRAVGSGNGGTLELNW